MVDGTSERVRPRDRILETAQDMFHKHGIKGVGIDAITEAAGTNKMTLYRHFDSKDDLIEILQRRASAFLAVPSQSTLDDWLRSVEHIAVAAGRR